MSRLLGGVISKLVLILLNQKSHADKNLKVAMSRLLGGVIFELVLILLNLDFKIDRS
jgi:hypothetical protein